MQPDLRRLTIQAIYRSRGLAGRAVDGLAGTLVNRSKKRFIKPEIPVAEFFQHLQGREVRYAVLRWFEDLPHVDRGHDIDLLIADEHVGRIADLLTYWPVGQPVDVYSVTGLPGYDYAPWFVKPRSPHAMALFPPHLAEAVLQRSVEKDGLFRVPNPEDHFFTLAYHAAYLKGPYSGLRSRADPEWKPARSSHDYAAALNRLGSEAGFELPQSPTYEELDDLLGRHGWRPPRDTLERMSSWSPWLRRRFLSEDTAAPDGLVAFFIRERAVDEGLKEMLLKAIRLRGFEILLVKELDERERARVASATRGGNWGPGPHARSGGRPACVVVAVDVFPTPAGEMRQFHAFLDNSRIQRLKSEIRATVNNRRPPYRQYNPLHSTDNKRHAWDVLQSLAPDEACGIAEKARASLRSFNAGQPGLKDLTRLGSRARVELVEWHGRPAVRKTFKPHCREFLRREAEALKALSESPCVPRLLETGENYLVIEYLDDAWSGRVPMLLPLRIVRQLADFIGHCARVGYDPIDLLPWNNLILDRGTGIKVIDFEFCVKRESGLKPESSYCLSGIPADFIGDAPVGVDYVFSPYALEWYRYTGLSLDSFLHAPPWRQQLERAFRYPGLMLKWASLPWTREVSRRAALRRFVLGIRKRFARGGHWSSGRGRPVGAALPISPAPARPLRAPVTREVRSGSEADMPWQVGSEARTEPAA